MIRERLRLAGFTLIEVLVTIAIVAVLMAVATPSFLEYRRNADLSDAVSGLVLASGTAKAAALKSGRNVFVQARDTSVGWSSGWIVFSDNDWDDVYDAGTDDLIQQHEALAADLTVTPASGTFGDGYLMFNGAGFPKTKANAEGKGAITLATTGRSTTVIVDNAGRIRSCKTGTTGCSAT